MASVGVRPAIVMASPISLRLNVPPGSLTPTPMANWPL